MTEQRSPPPPKPSGGSEPVEKPLPPYEPPRLARKRAFTRATLFSGGGGPSAAPLVPIG